MANFNWISVKEQMPEDDVDVLVCGVYKVMNDHYESFVRIGNYDPKLECLGQERFSTILVPAWDILGITYIEEYDDWGDYEGRALLQEGEDYIVTSWAPIPDASEEALKLVTSKP